MQHATYSTVFGSKSLVWIWIGRELLSKNETRTGRSQVRGVPYCTMFHVVPCRVSMNTKIWLGAVNCQPVNFGPRLTPRVWTRSRLKVPGTLPAVLAWDDLSAGFATRQYLCHVFSEERNKMLDFQRGLEKCNRSYLTRFNSMGCEKKYTLDSEGKLAGSSSTKRDQGAGMCGNCLGFSLKRWL